MSDFLLTEAVDEDDNEIENNEGNFVSTLSDEEFIDDESQFENQHESDYYGLTNIERSYDDAIQDSLSDFNFNQEANNYISDDLYEEKIDEFKDFEERIEKFKRTLFFPKEDQDENSFFYALLYAIRYHLTEKLDKVSDEYFMMDDFKIFEKIYQLKDFLKLDLKVSSFDDQCYTINHILNKYNLFLRVYEQKKNSDILLTPKRIKGKL